MKPRPKACSQCNRTFWTKFDHNIRCPRCERKLLAKRQALVFSKPWPIKDTPILTGEDARKFERDIEANKYRKVSQEEYERAVRAFNDVVVVSRREG
jgi:DNA-directed RNA polymerase subunit RPC12/RpoP